MVLSALFAEHGRLALCGALHPQAPYISQSIDVGEEEKLDRMGSQRCSDDRYFIRRRVHQAHSQGVQPSGGQGVSDRNTASCGHSEQGAILTPIPWKEALITDKLASWKKDIAGSVEKHLQKMTMRRPSTKQVFEIPPN